MFLTAPLEMYGNLYTKIPFYLLSSPRLESCRFQAPESFGFEVSDLGFGFGSSGLRVEDLGVQRVRVWGLGGFGVQGFRV